MSKPNFSIQELPGLDKVPAGQGQQPLRYTRQPGTFAWNVVDMLSRFSGKPKTQIVDFIIKAWAEKNLMTLGAIEKKLLDDMGGER